MERVMRSSQVDSIQAFSGFKGRCAQLIREYECADVCEIGGGRAPLFSGPELEELGLTYTVMDVSQNELDLAPPDVNKERRDICAPLVAGDHGRYDFMFSKCVAEHVKSGRGMHENVFAMLRPGGIAFHFFPTLYYPAFIVNRLLPEGLTSAMLGRIDREKFPAKYSKCIGPTNRAKRFVKSIGFDVIEYAPFYGTTYVDKIPVIRGVERAFSDWAARKMNPYFSSFAYLVLQKPAPGGREPS
jgi:2-polyprenyl-3-methyl-5-hydroxy-6-metoxy-1,4-benzoquinol methylase